VSDQPSPRSAELGLRTPIPYRAVFEFFPTGILVVDRRGQVTGLNLTAKRLLRDIAERPRLRCCDVFDCRRAGTPLAEHCITDLVLEHTGTMPEIRVDLAADGDAPAASVWVTGAPYGGAEPAVVFCMRAGVVGDRRRRTEPHWMGGPQLRVFTFGRSRVESGEGALAGEWLGHKPGHVFKYLVANRGRVVQTDELIEAFWPTAGPRGDRSVRQAIHTLRDRLEPHREKRGGSTFVLARSGGYELERSVVWIDADDFEASVADGLRALADGELEPAEAALARASGLYRGEFLAEEAYAEWALPERDRLRELAGQAMRALADVKEAVGDLDGATEQLARLAELEQYDVDIQRALVALLLRRGRRAEAVRRYEIFRHRHRKAFAEDPAFDLADVAAQVHPV
jgi:DNA-binding SARP family transcriptional activator